MGLGPSPFLSPHLGGKIEGQTTTEQEDPTVGKPKHSKTKPPKKRKRRSHFWRAFFRHYRRRAALRLKAAFVRTTGPKEIARASQDYDKDGTFIRPVIQPYPWRHYVAPEDLEQYAASIGGWEFEFQLLPEENVELKKAAYDAAAENFGPYVDSQPLDWIEAINDRARAVLPEKITA